MAQTGVQVLFGFLLTVSFTPRFDALAPGQRAWYFVTLTTAGAAAMLLIAPTAQHRILFRCGDKEHLVLVAHRYAIAGLSCVALSMVGALFFVGDVLFDGVVASLVATAAGAACVWCWYLQPLLRRLRLQRRAGA